MTNLTKKKNNWDSGNAWSMRDFILASKKPLDIEDLKLLDYVAQDCGVLSVYDLHRLNVLCYICIGYMEAKNQ